MDYFSASEVRILWARNEVFCFGDIKRQGNKQLLPHWWDTGCPIRYRTQHFFNNSNTNEDTATKFEQEYVRCVRNEKECVCCACLSSHFLHNEERPLQISLQYPH